MKKTDLVKYLKKNLYSQKLASIRPTASTGKLAIPGLASPRSKALAAVPLAPARRPGALDGLQDVPDGPRRAHLGLPPPLVLFFGKTPDVVQKESRKHFKKRIYTDRQTGR